MEFVKNRMKSSLQSSELPLLIESSSSSSSASSTPTVQPPSKALRQGVLTVENVERLPLSAGWKATAGASQVIEVVSATSVVSSAVDDESIRLLQVSVLHQQLANLEVQRLEAVVRKAANKGRALQGLRPADPCVRNPLQRTLCVTSGNQCRKILLTSPPCLEIMCLRLLVV